MTPPELRLEILQYVGKKDLKAVRLVNKDWSACASGYLFHRVYWSRQDLDLKVFGHIVGHTELARHVKELVFDGSQFAIDISKQQYFGTLCQQIWSCYRHQGSYAPLFGCEDPEIDGLNYLIWGRANINFSLLPIMTELWTRCGESRFVNEGYSRWIDCAQTQQKHTDDPGMLRQFTSGLAKLGKHFSIHIALPRYVANPSYRTHVSCLSISL